jgi:hypothetical protein
MPGLAAYADQVRATRYEVIMGRHSDRPGDLAAQLRHAGYHARAATPVTSAREQSIRDVAAGVAAPALIGFVVWVFEEARRKDVRRLRFLSRDGQILYELARRHAGKLGPGLDLEYVHSSRLTWSLAATDPNRLAATPWLFNSFMKSNAADVCTRLGLRAADFGPQLKAAGVSPDRACRADQPQQYQALQRFLRAPEVTSAAAARITQTRQLASAYARQHQLADPGTALVDAGWTGRMIGALVRVGEDAGMQRPHALLWGHEPRASGWTDPDRVSAWMYNTATGEGSSLRVPDAPFLVETFCMGDHGVVTGYRRRPDDQIAPILAADLNTPARDWGLALYRTVLYRACEFLTGPLDGEIRPLVHELMDAFWCSPTFDEAAAWRAYPYDSDPAGTSIRQLARPFDDTSQTDLAGVRGDRAWIHGSAALTRHPANLPPDLLEGGPAAD